MKPNANWQNLKKNQWKRIKKKAIKKVIKFNIINK